MYTPLRTIEECNYLLTYLQIILDKLNLPRLCGEKTIFETAEYQLSSYLLYYSWLWDSVEFYDVNCKQN